MDQQIIIESLTIFIIGMCTVFFVLCLIVWSSQLLIRLVNRIHHVTNKADEQTSSKRETIIREAIAKWSGGKATVKSIRKL